MAEWWYNTNFRSSIGMTPYEALYGLPPPNHLVTAIDTDTTPEFKGWVKEREQLTRELKDRLQLAQNRMKQQADRHRKEREYTEGDWVYLKLQPYRQSSVAIRKNIKLSARYFGPFKIIERVGQVAYRLLLPEGSRIHPVFHVSLLKKGPIAEAQATPHLPAVGDDGQVLAEPEAILGRRLAKRGNRATTEVLVQWSNLPVDRATWEDYWLLRQQFPSFDP